MVCCVIVGIALYIGLIVAHNDTEHTPTGDYVRLFVVCIAFYAPMYLLIPWWISVPAVVVLGAFGAYVRRTPVADKTNERPAAEESSESG